MGVVHKLRPEIKDYIVAQKKADLNLSCRKIAVIVKQAFNVHISKSSINSILKDAGLYVALESDPQILFTESVPSALPAGSSAVPSVSEAISPLTAAQPPIIKCVPSAEPLEPVFEPLPSIVEPLMPIVEPEPVVEPPVIEQPVVEPEPVVEPPVIDQQTVEPEPVFESLPSIVEPLMPIVEPEPVVEPPVIEQPVVEPEPVVEPPVIEQPIVESKPVVEPSVMKQPIVEPEPVVEPPVIDQPILEPVQPHEAVLVPFPQELPVVPEPAAQSVPEPVVSSLEDVRADMSSGILLLKAVDFIVGGSAAFVEAIRTRSWQVDPCLREKVEAVLCAAFLRVNGQFSDDDIVQVQSFTGKKISREFLLKSIQELQGVSAAHADILNLIPSRVKDVRCLRGTLSDGQVFSIDGQFHTLWSTLSIPYDFASTIWRVADHINSIAAGKEACILAMAPGYDMPTKEFFAMLAGFEGRDARVEKFALYGNQFEEMDVIPFSSSGRVSLIFGVWPWQFTGCRKVHAIGEFKPLKFDALARDFGTAEVAEISLELSQPVVNKRVTLRGAALKLNPTGKIRLLILSNQPAEHIAPEQLALEYLRRWPNLDEGSQDYSRKIELFTYQGVASPRVISSDLVKDHKESLGEIMGLFGYYVKVLDYYINWHFFPVGSPEKSHLLIKDVLSRIKASIRWFDEDVMVNLSISPEISCAKELPYVCRRMNEHDIRSFGGRHVWLSAGAT